MSLWVQLWCLLSGESHGWGYNTWHEGCCVGWVGTKQAEERSEFTASLLTCTHFIYSHSECMLIMPVGEVPILSLTLFQAEGEGILTACVLKTIVLSPLSAGVGSWALFSMCFCSPLTTLCRTPQSSYCGGAGRGRKTLSGGQPCSWLPPMLWFTRASASWWKMPFSVRHQNQNPDLYDNFKSRVQAPGGCSWNGIPLAYINLFQRNRAVDAQWGRNRLSVHALGISWCLGDLGKK